MHAIRTGRDMNHPNSKENLNVAALALYGYQIKL